MFTLSIAKPCHERWEKMLPVGRGAYCDSCCKNVIDFTGMRGEEILNYFQKKTGEPVCGRFRNDQLNRPLIEISPSIFMMKIPFWKKFLAALFIYFSAFITGCSSTHEKDYTQLEVPIVSNCTSGMKQTNVQKLISRDPASDEFTNITSGFTLPVHQRTQFNLPDFLLNLKEDK